MAVRIGTEDHIAIVVPFQIGDLAQQGDGVVAGCEAFGLSNGGDASCSIWWRWAGSSGILALLEGAVGDLAQEAERAVFSVCRPAGHHASQDLAGGYCYLNNAAIAAQAHLNTGARRVALLDVDYHHGNGTQRIFYHRSDVFFISLHCRPQDEYPFLMGYDTELGEGAGKGYNLNLPLPHGTGYAD